MAGPAAGVVGLGAMGLPIAAHLARAGLAVTVYDRDRARVAEAVAAGCAGAVDAAGAAREVTLVVVPSDEDVLAVHREIGVTAALLVVCSSVHPDTVRALARDGARVLDAALTGGLRAAAEGSVNLLVGGDERDLAAARPVLDPWCATVHHLGPLGAGQIAKSANNLVHWAQICALEEALDLARRHGLSVPAVRAALSDGPTDSRTLRELERMRLTWWRKDLASLTRLGDDVGRPTPVAQMCRETMPALSVASLHELLGAEPPSVG